MNSSVQIHLFKSYRSVQLLLCFVFRPQCCNRDTRLLAGTAVAMLINTAPESRAGEAAAWSLLQVFHSGR